MAFKNSTGDIVLDAVLTDVGRKHMAQGKFKITKFALGDDEIDYSFFVHKNTSTSLSEHDDTILLDTPILEAFGGQDSNIQYGLQNFIREDILYYPKIILNTKLDDSTTPATDGFIYLAANRETRRKLDEDIGGRHVIQNNKSEFGTIVIESGIDNLDIEPTQINKDKFITQMGLYDKYFLAYVDSRFIDNINFSPANSLFENDIADNLFMNLGPLARGIPVSLQAVSDFHQTYQFIGIDNNVLNRSHSCATNRHSSIKGPRATICAFNFEINKKLSKGSDSTPDFRYTKFGKTSSSINGSSNLYDFIDITIYIQAMSSGARLSIPIRITRYAGT